jgi:hypothetical protein
METLGKIIEVKLVWLHCKKFSYEYLSLFFRLFTLCSATVNAFRTAFSNSTYEMGDLSDFSKRTDCWCAFSCSICNQDGHCIRCSRAPVSKVLTAHTNHGNASLAKRNSGQKPKLGDTDRHSFMMIMSTNHKTTAAKVTP